MGVMASSFLFRRMRSSLDNLQVRILRGQLRHGFLMDLELLISSILLRAVIYFFLHLIKFPCRGSRRGQSHRWRILLARIGQNLSLCWIFLLLPIILFFLQFDLLDRGRLQLANEELKLVLKGILISKALLSLLLVFREFITNWELKGIMANRWIA